MTDIEPKKPRVRNQTKAAGGITLTGALTTLAAVEAQKHGYGPEYSVPIASAILGFLGAWAGKLKPH